MSNDIFKIKPTKAAAIQEAENFTIYSPSEIMQKMRMLAKGRCLVTAYFEDGNQSFMTAIIDILPEKKMIVVDYGPDEGMNKRIMSEPRVIFKSDLAGISAQWSVHHVRKARFKDQLVFAFEVPDEMLWIQRRDTYRVAIPLSVNAQCQFTHSDDTQGQYRILDISAGGLALEDKGMHEDFQMDQVLKASHINLPEHGGGIVTLKICNILPLRKDKPEEGQRIGCVFQNLPSDLDATIQRFILSIDSMRKRVSD
ncbi:MAG: flagellar brake protein [Gammaproteobacteria bacterium]|nr:flagellar brake protein [Gammaproteobacteria bacterium]MDH5653026.1 flagellar brake protein [Gammaproteobacteria bacterium]